jgi:CDP-diacylglycerol--serine O-phosphatidyltransferase
VFSGKRVGKRIAPEMVLPVFVAVVLFFALLISYPWWVLSIGTVLYLASLPFGPISYREYQRKDEAARLAAEKQEPAPARMPSVAPPPLPAGQPASDHPPNPDRPARLN